jgi:glycosyltransferase involved in cell wall biosynthesis
MQAAHAIAVSKCQEASSAATGRKAKIKLIHIYKDFDIYNGLIEEFLLFAQRIDPEKYDFTVCVFNYKGSPFGQRFQDLGGKLHNLQCGWEDNPLIIYSLYKYLKKSKPHIVQTYILKPNLYGRIAAFLAGVPVIISTELTLKNQAHSLPNRFRDSLLHPLNSILNKFTDVILCASDAIRQQWQTRKHAHRFKVLHPYFDPEKIRESTRRRDETALAGKDDWVIGTVGRLSEEKRHIDLLKSFHNVQKVFPKATLLIVGDGHMRGKLINEARRLGIAGSVTFAGFQTNVSEYLDKMDVFVLPSRTEGFPLVLLEAMTMGLPVVATNVGGIPELVVNDETGVLVRPSHPEELSQAITTLLSNPEKMCAIAHRGKVHVLATYSARKFIHEHEVVYESMLAAKGVVGGAQPIVGAYGVAVDCPRSNGQGSDGHSQ